MSNRRFTLNDPPDIDDPRYGGNLAAYNRAVSEWLDMLADELQRREVPSREPYTVSNPTTSRSLDVSAATLGELRQVVGTLIEDLVTQRILRTKG
jgi:hypothetical protein